MAVPSLRTSPNPHLRLDQKVLQINWGLLALVAILGAVGCFMLYSAANGRMDPWASRQLIRLGVGTVLLLGIALTDIRIWFRFAYLIYLGGLGLLGLVEVMGSAGMGAERWINLGFFQIQPSELMKVGLVLGLARYFHGLSQEEVARPFHLILPLCMVLVPAGLVLKQPDLGTAAMLLMAGAAVYWLGGVRIWKFAVVGAGGLAAIPIAWGYLRPYQRQRVLTFVNPENDPLGSGYHILQSKIAFGSGGVTGRGFMQGTQGHLSFLPEKHTDFIFTMLAEEFGMLGSLGVLLLFTGIFVYGFAIALRSRNHFGRILALGLTVNLFLYVFINMAMVMGLIPVVGVPLPLVSYGGTSMVAVMASVGLIMSVYIHRDIRIPRTGLYSND